METNKSFLVDQILGSFEILNRFSFQSNDSWIHAPSHYAMAMDDDPLREREGKKNARKIVQSNQFKFDKL